jgi:D-glycero-alpha-D-manno-heptose 1-phosphate guanylyltransferase
MSNNQTGKLNIDVLILCGGLGTRVKNLLDGSPKSMAKINKTPFLDLLINQLKKNGIFSAIFCVGYQSSEIIEYYKNRKDFNCIFSLEETALGTGGAIKNAIKKIKSNNFFVLNGDSISSLNFESFYSYHLLKNSFISIAVTKKTNANDFGSIFLDENNMISSFCEKEVKENFDSKNNFINAGVYLFKKESLKYFQGREDFFSLEYDIFPSTIKLHNCFAYVLDDDFYDIGSPERLLNANKNLLRFFSK